ncbi:hypothetical protein P4213_25405, partial [Bacillus thuringiensis]|nr:hypothetical protein [Bacillus thuringiensis]
SKRNESGGSSIALIKKRLGKKERNPYQLCFPPLLTIQIHHNNSKTNGILLAKKTFTALPYFLN